MTKKRLLPIEAVPGGILEYEGLHGDDGTLSTVGALIAHITALSRVDPVTLAEAISMRKGAHFLGDVHLRGVTDEALLDRFEDLKPASPEPLSSEQYDEFLAGGGAPGKAQQSVSRKLEKIFGDLSSGFEERAGDEYITSKLRTSHTRSSE